jgi:tRNA pseudouridine38-40 synthase
MVRRLTGMITEVGRGNASVREFERLLKFKSNAAAQYTAPPSGLFLEKVLYEGDDAPNQNKSLFPLN